MRWNRLQAAPISCFVGVALLLLGEPSTNCV